MNTQPQENNEQALDSRHPVIQWIDRNKLGIAGFFGWYIVNGVIWLILGSGENLLYGIFGFPINLLTLIILGRFIKSTRQVASGIVIALAVNFVLSLLVGLFFNGVCFIPFYVK